MHRDGLWRIPGRVEDLNVYLTGRCVVNIIDTDAVLTDCRATIATVGNHFGSHFQVLVQNGVRFSIGRQ